MKIQYAFPFLCCLFLAQIACGQPFFFEGQVLDDAGEPLISANIHAIGSGTYVATDFDGFFTISLKSETDSLCISYVGFHTLCERVHLSSSKKKRKFVLDSGVALLAEVVVAKRESRRRTTTGRKKRRARRSPASVPLIEQDATSYSNSIHRESIAASRERKVSPAPPLTNVQAGLLTAGEINDFSKWELWNDIAEQELAQFQTTWGIRPLERYSFQLQTESGLPIIDASVFLEQNGQLIWEARTDNTGKAELWSNATGEGQKGKTTIRVEHQGESHDFGKAKQFHKGLNVLELPLACAVPNQTDIAWVVDATASMLDEIQYLKTELGDVIGQFKDSMPQLDLRMGAVFYRDHGEEYLTRQSDLSDDIAQTIEFIDDNYARGGGDVPEAVDAALDVAIHELSWSEEARARVIFLILDAPPHSDPSTVARLQAQIRAAAQKGIRIVPLTCSGIDKSTEYLMRSTALLTNGTYTFLTDDSGIGLPHLKPSTDSYNVEKLNDLIPRLLFQYTYAPECQEEETVLAAIGEPLQVWEQKQSKPNPAEGKGKKPFEWKYYPNPSRGEVTIQVNRPIKQLFLTDLSGKILKRILWEEGKLHQLDLSWLPSGLYLLSCEYEEGSWVSGKVVLQREGTQMAFQASAP
ncbi:MAG: carboxypeptidase-like regulatory domain-containing protein [Bacteroidota bacterium]